MKVLMMVKHPTNAKVVKQLEGGGVPKKEEMLAMGAFNDEMRKAGVLLDLSGLTPTTRGARIHYEGKKRTVIDGPFAEAKEQISGYWLIQVKTFAEAVEWAKRAPFGNGVENDEPPEVELRPLFEIGDLLG